MRENEGIADGTLGGPLAGVRMQIAGWVILLACFALIYYLIRVRQRDKNSKESKSSTTDDNEYRGPPIAPLP